ncbi:MAG TPA: hypothetical protein VKX17_27405 [Planctomycetota bacterium]|nr:hypothetical protein [Planctomycetota bacterium]
MRRKTIEELIEEDKQDENVQRIRRVRQELHRLYPTVDALFAHLDEFEKKHPRRMHIAKTTTSKRGKTRQAKPKPVETPARRRV